MLITCYRCSIQRVMTALFGLIVATSPLLAEEPILKHPEPRVQPARLAASRTAQNPPRLLPPPFRMQNSALVRHASAVGFAGSRLLRADLRSAEHALAPRTWSPRVLRPTLLGPTAFEPTSTIRHSLTPGMYAGCSVSPPREWGDLRSTAQALSPQSGSIPSVSTFLPIDGLAAQAVKFRTDALARSWPALSPDPYALSVVQSQVKVGEGIVGFFIPSVGTTLAVRDFVSAKNPTEKLEIAGRSVATGLVSLSKLGPASKFLDALKVYRDWHTSAELHKIMPQQRTIQLDLDFTKGPTRTMIHKEITTPYNIPEALLGLPPLGPYKERIWTRTVTTVSPGFGPPLRSGFSTLPAAPPLRLKQPMTAPSSRLNQGIVAYPVPRVPPVLVDPWGGGTSRWPNRTGGGCFGMGRP